MGILQIALHGRTVQFGMAFVVIFLFDPGLGRQVQQIQCQSRFTFQHGQQATLKLGPEELHFRILIGRIRQGGLMQNPQSL
jgi:hypothetical protein